MSATGSDRLGSLVPVAEALDLVRRQDRRRFRRVERFIRRIFLANWKTFGTYYPVGRVCGLKALRRPRTDKHEVVVHAYAYILIHEATHGLINSKMFAYTETNRSRIERICHKEAVYFLSRFPKTAVEVLCLLNPTNAPKISRWRASSGNR